ncbi:hypothetical protein ACS248_17030, partial [Dickeya lacustris]
MVQWVYVRKPQGATHCTHLKSWHTFSFSLLTATTSIHNDIRSTTINDQSGEPSMSAEHVLTMLNEHEVKFVDLRFTDTKG